MTNEDPIPPPRPYRFPPDPHDYAEEEEPGAIEPLEPASRRPGGPVSRRIYTTGIPGLDSEVSDLIATLKDVASTDAAIAREIITSALRLVTQHASRGELKLVNAALKEFAYSFRVFAPYRHLPKVSIFGSARVSTGDLAYIATREFAAEIARRGWMVITGAGPGIMAAGHEGAGAEHSFGANIRLPALNPANAYIAKDGKLINFKYFFTRKVTFLKESSAFVLLPGGWGTLDETFELLTLVQTGKSDLHPIVLLEPEGSTYWRDWLRFIQEDVLGRGFILETDLALFTIATTPEEAVEEIESFYRNYHSARFVGERLILRLHHAPDTEALARLNAEFADLLHHGDLEVIEPTPPEVHDNDALDLARIAFYPRHAYGRLRQLIDALNSEAPASEATPPKS
ncbi:MAG: TIGR00730 family Rossman fold protein [Dehalococcoidia bacterium]|nr:TIGR00730 family Rossman fold protein [Dehalococcoidia bacterium]